MVFVSFTILLALSTISGGDPAKNLTHPLRPEDGNGAWSGCGFAVVRLWLDEKDSVTLSSVYAARSIMS